MADMTQTQSQGKFISTGATQTIKLRSDVDWVEIYNVTNATAAQTTVVPVKWYWQRGFPAAAGWVTLKSNAANAANLDVYQTTNGFTLVDSSSQTPGPTVAVTSTSNANPFVVATGSTAGLSNGDVVRLQGVNGQQNVNGYDFAIANLIANTSFTPAMTFERVPGGVGGAAGFYRKIPFNPIYYPSNRTIVNITNAAQAVVTVTVAHTYKVGQVVTFRIRDPYSMTQMDGLTATITAVTTYTFTIDLDTTAFETFIWADYATAATYPTVLPVGEDTSKALSAGTYEFSDATINQSYIGISMAGGATAAAAGPAGIANDVIYWRAGVSFQNDATGLLIV